MKYDFPFGPDKRHFREGKPIRSESTLELRQKTMLEQLRLIAFLEKRLSEIICFTLNQKDKGKTIRKMVCKKTYG